MFVLQLFQFQFFSLVLVPITISSTISSTVDHHFTNTHTHTHTLNSHVSARMLIVHISLSLSPILRSRFTISQTDSEKVTD